LLDEAAAGRRGFPSGLDEASPAAVVPQLGAVHAERAHPAVLDEAAAGRCGFPGVLDEASPAAVLPQ
jgi:hypothetical protein